MKNFDLEKIYTDMELYLIENIKRNLLDEKTSFHLREEKELGFEWEAWQSAKLRDLRRYRKQNKSIIEQYTKGFKTKLESQLREEEKQGKLLAYNDYKGAITKGLKGKSITPEFFNSNGRKVNALINSVNNDFDKVNTSVLRKSNDIYRQIIAESSLYVTHGIMTPLQAIKKSINDFEKRGINSIEYKDGSRHTISEYSKMALRTANTRAQLMGEGELRKQIGCTLIKMSSHNTSCKLCAPWQGVVLIDDVYSGGSKSDGNYPLLSEAMKQGLYHPNCRHGHSTYFPELEEINAKYNDSITEYDSSAYDNQQKQREYERKIRDTKLKKKFALNHKWDEAYSKFSNDYKTIRDEYKKFLSENNMVRHTENESVSYSNKLSVDDVFGNKSNKRQFQMLKDFYKNNGRKGNKFPKSFDNFIKMKYNDSYTYKKFVRQKNTVSKILSKDYSSPEFKTKVLNQYYEFYDDGYEFIEHAVSRYIDRSQKYNFTKYDIYENLSKGSNYLQGNHREIFYYDNLTVVRNKYTKEVVSLLKRKNPKKEWIKK